MQRLKLSIPADVLVSHQSNHHLLVAAAQFADFGFGRFIVDA